MKKIRMKKFLMCFLMVASIFMIFTVTAQAAESNTTITGWSTEGEHEFYKIGGTLPSQYDGTLNGGLTFEFNQPNLFLAEIEKEGDNSIVLKMHTAGITGESFGYVFFAVYDENDRLTFASEVKEAVVGISKYTWNGIAFTDYMKIRAFVWDSTSLIPQCAAYDVTFE